MKPTTFRDKLNSVSPKAASNAAMAVINALQHYRQEEQAVGLAAAFLALCRRYEREFSVQDLMTVTNNVLFSRHGSRPEFRALAHYMEQEQV